MTKINQQVTERPITVIVTGCGCGISSAILSDLKKHNVVFTPRTQDNNNPRENIFMADDNSQLFNLPIDELTKIKLDRSLLQPRNREYGWYRIFDKHNIYRK